MPYRPMLDVPLPKFVQCRPGSSSSIFIPERSHEGDAGHDIRVYIDQPAWNEEVEERFRAYWSWCQEDYPKHHKHTLAYVMRVNRTPILNLSDNPSLSDLRAQLVYWENLLRNSKGILVRPGERVVLPAGFKVELPKLPQPWTMYMQIVSRSGWCAVDRICVTNSPGIVDYKYRDEVMVSLENRSMVNHLILNETRVGQAIFGLALSCDMRQNQVQDIKPTERGRHGSTGLS